RKPSWPNCNAASSKRRSTRRLCASGSAPTASASAVRDQRTRVLQTLFGPVRVAAPRVKLHACVDKGGFSDVSFSPLSDLLPDRCTPDVRNVQAELGARHSFCEASAFWQRSYPAPCEGAKPAALGRGRTPSRETDATVTSPVPDSPKASDPGIVF